MGYSPDAGHPTLVTFGARVRRRRKEIGLTLEDLGERCGLHWSYLSQVEKGRRNVGLMNVTAIAQALDVDAGSLIAGCTRGAQGEANPMKE